MDVELVLECALPVRSLTKERRAPPEVEPPPPPVLLFGDMGAVKEEAVAVDGLATVERCIVLFTTTTFGSRYTTWAVVVQVAVVVAGKRRMDRGESESGNF